tara:strand:+ start:198 stop:701 length:504 start_codon:yes stop_codon:yes gene_type:complete
MMDSWFFTGVIYDMFVVYDLVCLAMLGACAIHYNSRSARIAAACYLLVVVMGSFDSFLTLHLMIQKALYALPFIVGVLFVNKKVSIMFAAFIFIQIVYMAENLFFGIDKTIISSSYPVLCFLSVILITTRISEGESRGGNIIDHINNLYRNFLSNHSVHNHANQKKQ